MAYANTDDTDYDYDYDYDGTDTYNGTDVMLECLRCGTVDYAERFHGNLCAECADNAPMGECVICDDETADENEEFCTACGGA